MCPPRSVIWQLYCWCWKVSSSCFIQQLHVYCNWKSQERRCSYYRVCWCNYVIFDNNKLFIYNNCYLYNRQMVVNIYYTAMGTKWERWMMFVEIRVPTIIFEKCPGLWISQRTVGRARRELGWVFQTTRYGWAIWDPSWEGHIWWCHLQWNNSWSRIPQ